MDAVKDRISAGGFFKVEKGAYASHSGRLCKVRRVLGVDCALIEYADTEETERVLPTALRPPSAATPRTKEDKRPDEGAEAETETVRAPPARKEAHDINEWADDVWDEAKKLYELIKPLLEKHDRTRADVEAFAQANNVNASTVYGWMKDYNDAGHMSGLIRWKRGRKKNSRLCDPDVEKVIDMVLDADYENPQALTPGAVIGKIKDKLNDLKLTLPHDNTLRNRIAAIPLHRQLKTRGNRDKYKQATEPRPGEFPDADFPLQCVQIDHMEIDRQMVDEQTRQPIATRAWLTLAIDVYSRLVVGFFLSFMKPSAFSAGVCLYMAMMDKKELLARLNLPGRWPVYGKMRKVHADNAKEFKGHMLVRACDEHNIDLQLRPLDAPHYGAHIERMVGNVNRELHKKKGTTHSNPRVSPDYDPMKEAVYTISETETDIVDWLVNVYSVRKHSALNTTPLRKWEVGVMGDKDHPGSGLPEVPADPEKLRLDFLPFKLRTIQNYGVEIDVRLYYQESLKSWINAPDPEDPKKKRKFIFRYDPRTIRKIWFYDPELKKYFEVGLSDRRWPDMTWSEYDEYRRLMDAEGLSHVDEEAILGYVLRSKARDAEASEKTRLAQRTAKKAAKNAALNAGNSAPASTMYAETPKGSGTAVETHPLGDDLFAADVTPFEDDT